MFPSVRRSSLIATALLLVGAASAAAAPTPPYKRTVIVGGGTAAQNGTALRAAMAGTGAAGPSNRWLIHLEPGIYALGANGLQLKNFVDVEGSGRDVTTVTSTASNQPVFWAQGGGIAAEVRDLSLQNTAAAGQSFGFNIDSSGVTVSRVNVSAKGPDAFAITVVGGSPKLVEIVANATATANAGFAIGFNFQNTATNGRDLATSVTAKAQATGLQLIGGAGAQATVDGLRVRIAGAPQVYGISLVDSGAPASLRLSRADIEVSGAQAFGITMSEGGVLEMSASSASAAGTVPDNGVGLLVGGDIGTVAVEHSTLKGNDYSIFNATSTPVRIAMTRLVGPVVGLTPGWACVGAYNQNFALLNGTCR